MTDSNAADALFLGLDSSTQTLKATLMDRGLNLLHEARISFDRDLPEFRTEGGVHRHPDGLTVTSPAIMWVAALDLLCARMRSEGWPLGRVAAISGSGQQHGSVWLKRGAGAALQGVCADRTLREQLAWMFAVEDSPVWMDSSTGVQCRALEQKLGGAQAVAELTGSRAYERFTGNQIAKICEQRPVAYEATERISLVSSFMASLLVGGYAPIDASDGSGMNLMDLRTRDWSERALEATAPALRERLGDIVPSHADVGAVHAYFVERYGFNPACRVIAFSGDNPNSLAGLRLERSGDLAISMGTSDTVFGFLSDPKPSATEGHVFANPVDPRAYMAMICYKNGSLTREYVRDEFAGGTWAGFQSLVRETPPGNGGKVALYIREPEITPPILKTGVFRFGPDGAPVSAFSPAENARAVLEGQFLSIRLHGANVGLKAERILATGGASVDPAVLRVMSDVLGCSVHVAECSDSASLGAAYRALHGWMCGMRGVFVPFGEVVAAAPPFRKAVEPDMQAHAVYTAMLEHYAACERAVLAGQS